jgi:hypothetical protein
MGINDADDLVHPRPFVVFGLQRRARKTFVDIAHDRLRLVERETVMLEGGDLGERLARQVQPSR